MSYLDLDTYDRVLLRALQNLGLKRRQADALLASRWPVAAAGAVCEAYGRGLVVTLDDVRAWLVERMTTVTDDDNAERLVDQHFADVLLEPSEVEEFLSWSVATTRAQQTPVGEQCEARPDVVAMLCRSAKPELN